MSIILITHRKPRQNEPGASGSTPITERSCGYLAPQYIRARSDGPGLKMRARPRAPRQRRTLRGARARRQERGNARIRTDLRPSRDLALDGPTAAADLADVRIACARPTGRGAMWIYARRRTSPEVWRFRRGETIGWLLPEAIHCIRY